MRVMPTIFEHIQYKTSDVVNMYIYTQTKTYIIIVIVLFILLFLNVLVVYMSQVFH